MAGIWRLLLATPEAVPAARHALAELDEVDTTTKDVVELLVSELVTNAVRHGASNRYESILLHATCGTGAVRVEVCDEGPGFKPGPDPRGVLEPGGNGLLLVAELATRWGVEPGNGKPTCVWFESDYATTG
ncbi:MAG: serine/threonine-protein kinase RsbW [Thermoleophilaceae bacterium]|jgi:anti-sigma regulatory factor (Ser/Thr protein kinase)|nr:serine/threonine-protein kinase RsbW [Thermoleophilaceae bacterium]